jgi:hypothetical protein
METLVLEPVPVGSHHRNAHNCWQSINVEVALPPDFALPLHTDRQEDIGGTIRDTQPKLRNEPKGARRGNGKTTFLVFALALANAKKAGLNPLPNEPNAGPAFTVYGNCKTALSFPQQMCRDCQKTPRFALRISATPLHILFKGDPA